MAQNEKQFETKQSSITNLGFFKYFKSLVGSHMYVYILFNFIVGLLDGLGLTMFVPLMAVATKTDIGKNSLGKLDFLPKLFESLHIPLTLGSVLAMMVSIFVVKSILSYFRQLYFLRIRLGAIKKIRFQLVDGLHSLSYRGYTQSDPGRIQFSMVGETARVVTAFNNYITSIQYLIVLLTYVLLAFFANWQFALLVAIGGIISNFLYRIINSKTRLVARRLSKVGNQFNGFLIQAIQNFKYLKATNNFSNYRNNLEHTIDEFEKTQFRIGNLNAIATNLREPIIMTIISIVILIQIKVMGGNFGSIVIGLMLFYRALNYLVMMQNSWNYFTANSSGLDALLELQEDFKSYTEDVKSDYLIDRIHTINLQNVHLQYNDHKILSGINLNIPERSTIAFVGESGAGKTTLANIVGGLVDSNAGEIEINGEPIQSFDINSYRNRVGFIAQDATIFNDTIYNNITFWAPKTKENIERFNDAVEMVHLRQFIDSLELKEDSPLGNDGILVSGGQKQRISIARELFRDVDLLIMDEATSALDSETEKIIKENIDDLHGKYTLIIIAHRLSTIKNADEIYVLDKGRIVESGSFEELYHKDNAFKRMVDLQEV